MRKVEIIIPLYREKKRLEPCIEQLENFIERNRGAFDFSVVFVDDGSGDGTGEYAKSLAAEHSLAYVKVLVLPENLGKGGAIRTGVLQGSGDLILMTDCDLSAPLEEWRHLLAAVESGADFAFASRARERMENPPPFYRRLLSKIFHFAVCLAGVRDFHDTQCGFKLFKTEAARRVFSELRIMRFAFDVELILRARKMGYRVDEVPVVWNYSTGSTVRVFSSGSKMLFDLARIFWWRLTGRF